jgi:hypothetical protein
MVQFGDFCTKLDFFLKRLVILFILKSRSNGLTIEIFELEQVWWHRSCIYFGGKNTS